MNFGLCIRHALGKASLPDDAEYLEIAKTECNFVLEELWYKTKSKYRHSRGQIVTEVGADEYVLNKYMDEFVKNSLQGPTTSPRFFKYRESEEFFRTIRLQHSTSGQPYIYTFGDLVGYDKQLDSASKIRVFSSLASKTTGQVQFVAGSDAIKSATDIFTLNDTGRRIKKSGDNKTYKIGKYVSPREMRLLEKYRGTSSTSNYALGDVGVRVNIQGYVGGEIDSEDIELDGSNVILTTKTFNTIVSNSKSDRTGGKITIQNESGSETVGSMAPGETEIERQTVILWPKPDSAETLKYRFFMKHPILWLDTDRMLIRSKWHHLVTDKTERRLRAAFGKDVSQELKDDIKEAQEDFENEAEDTSLTDMVPDGDERRHGDQFFYDHDEDFS